MTLERWSVHRYRMPHLHIEAIHRRSDALELHSQRGVFRLAVDGAASLDDDVLPMLESLRDPHSALWDSIGRRGPGAAELAPMLREFDHLGLIRDCAAAGAAESQQAIERALWTWSAALGADIASHGEPGRRLLQMVAERLATPGGEALALTMAERSFPIQTILLQARYWRADAPSVLGLLIHALLAAERYARLGEHGAWWSGIEQLPSWAEADWVSGLVEPAVAGQYLAATGALVRAALGDGAQRRTRPAAGGAAALSGINFLLDLEAEVALMLADLGASAALTAMDDPVRAPGVVRAAFLQEYLVTCRFVECVAPLLSRRFAAPLRDAVHRYFAEEVGHEKFERENCLRLGMTAAQIDAAVPMPLHLAFIDILTSLARESPVAFFCASMFTEGFIGGEDSLMSMAQQALPDDPALLRAIGTHVAVNDHADHRGVGRDWLSHVPLVAPSMQAEVREMIAFLAELNWRMWDQLVSACGAGEAPRSWQPRAERPRRTHQPA
jgi:hypothetical protein